MYQALIPILASVLGNMLNKKGGEQGGGSGNLLSGIGGMAKEYMSSGSMLPSVMGKLTGGSDEEKRRLEEEEALKQNRINFPKPTSPWM